MPEKSSWSVASFLWMMVPFARVESRYSMSTTLALVVTVMSDWSRTCSSSMLLISFFENLRFEELMAMLRPCAMLGFGAYPTNSVDSTIEKEYGVVFFTSSTRSSIACVSFSSSEPLRFLHTRLCRSRIARSSERRDLSRVFLSCIAFEISLSFPPRVSSDAMVSLIFDSISLVLRSSSPRSTDRSLGAPPDSRWSRDASEELVLPSWSLHSTFHSCVPKSKDPAREYCPDGFESEAVASLLQSTDSDLV